MAQQDGFEIYQRFYPWPERFRMGDPILIKQLSDLTWREFAEGLNDYYQSVEESQAAGEDPAEPDPSLLIGLVAVAFWQGNPLMSREKVRRIIEKLDMEKDFQVVAGDDSEGSDVNPPAETSERPGEEPSSTLPESELLLDANSVSPNPNDSGSPSSHSLPPELLLA